MDNVTLDNVIETMVQQYDISRAEAKDIVHRNLEMYEIMTSGISDLCDVLDNGDDSCIF